jgi:hypothetical protein
MNHSEDDPLPGRPEVMNSIGSPKTISRFHDAEVIIGIDEETGNSFLMFGREVLQNIIDTNQARNVRVVPISILQRTLELEALCAAVQVAKGKDEYQSNDDFPWQLVPWLER